MMNPDGTATFDSVWELDGDLLSRKPGRVMAAAMVEDDKLGDEGKKNRVNPCNPPRG
jgi:hypothetical protein